MNGRMVMSVVRHIVTAAGGILVGMGLVSRDVLDQATGGGAIEVLGLALAIAAAIAGVLEKQHVKRTPPVAAPATQDVSGNTVDGP